MVKRFYLCKEGDFHVESDLVARFLAPSDLKHIETPEKTFWMFFGEMVIGNKCIGLIKDGGVVSYIWINERFLENHGIKEPLKGNEVCFYNAETKPEEKGKGYAGILRSKAYDILRGMGKDTFYSFTDVKNIPALRFKEKIGAKVLKTYKYVEFWKYKKCHEIV